MEERKNQGLMERVEHLETEVETQGRELRYAIRRLNRLLADHTPGNVEATTAAVSSPPERSVGESRRGGETSFHPSTGVGDGDRGRGFAPLLDLWRLRGGEWWLNKVGIGLLLFGAVFLFKFSVDQNWITPPVRVGVGLALGALLMVFGLRVYEERRSFSQALLGGGVGTFYITGFAAFQLYALVPYPVAFAFMVAVTLLAFVFALRQDGVALALIGTLGGLGTPFILYEESGSMAGLVLYTCLILSGTAAIYLFKGWRSLLVVSFAGVWMVFLTGSASITYASETFSADRATLQAGVVFSWLALWLAPTTRQVLRARNPPQWSPPEGGSAVMAPADVRAASDASAHTVILATPLVALAFTQGIWGLAEETLGWVSLGAAALYALFSMALRRVEGGGGDYYVQALAALLLGTLSMVLLLEGAALFFALAAEATALHFVSRRLSDRVVAFQAHALSLIVGGWLAYRILPGPVDAVFGYGTADTTVLNPLAFVDLAVIGLLVASSTVLERNSWRVAYRMLGHVAVLGIILRELSSLPNGDAYVTIAWGAYAAALLILGLRLDRDGLARLGLATLLLTAGKLFLVDLASVEAVWRILLFLGFGTLFLTLGYYLQALWRPRGGQLGRPG